MADISWETEEVERWLVNDEYLYDQAMELVERCRDYDTEDVDIDELAKRLEAWAKDTDLLTELNIYEDNPDPHDVDWEEVARTLAS